MCIYIYMHIYILYIYTYLYMGRIPEAFGLVVSIGNL